MKNNIFEFFDNIILSNSLNSNTRNIYKVFSIDDKKELINLLSPGGDYSIAWNNFLEDKYIYRGTYNNYLSKKDLAVEVTPGIRVSLGDVPNLYTILMSDILDSWKKFPKRNRSHICTTDVYKADAFGSTKYYVFPKNNAKIGVCSSEDIWDGFINKYDFLTAVELVRKIVYILDIVINKNVKESNQYLIEKQFTDAVKTKNLFKKFDTEFDKTTDEQREILEKNFLQSQKYCSLLTDYIHFVKNKNNNKSDFLKFLEKYVFSTKGFKIVDYKKFSHFNDSIEIWFEGPAIYIPTTFNKLEWLEKNVRTD
jgi:hypothetical protein